MIHWLIHSKDSFQTADSFRNEASDGCLYEWGQWITDSNDLFKNTESFSNKTHCVAGDAQMWLNSVIGVGAIPVWTWLPVLCCAMIWILLYRGYRYIFMDFIGWTDKDYFPRGYYCIIRERERCPRLIGHKSDSEPDSFCSKHTIGFSELHTNWITIISQNVICVVILLSL